MPPATQKPTPCECEEEEPCDTQCDTPCGCGCDTPCNGGCEEDCGEPCGQEPCANDAPCNETGETSSDPVLAGPAVLVDPAVVAEMPTARPTKVPKQPVQTPTKVMDIKVKSQEESSPFSDDAKIPALFCAEKTAESQKNCFELKSSDDETQTGSVCVEIHGSPPAMELTYKSSDNWALTQADFWLGDDLSAMPTKKNGYPKLDKFPYFWCNSTGEVSWGTKFPFNATQHCPSIGSHGLSAVAHSLMEKRFENTTLDKSTKQHAFGYNMTDEASSKFFSWFNMSLECGCSKYEDPRSTLTKKEIAPAVPAGCTGQVTSTASKCYDLKTKEKTAVGSVCLEMHGSPSMLEIKYESSADFALTKTGLWFGLDSSALSTDANGFPDASGFDLFWRNSSGENEWFTTVPMASHVACSKTEDLVLSMVAQSVVAKVLSDGTLDSSSFVEAFASVSPEDRGIKGSGVFQFPLQCECAEEKSSENLLSSSDVSPSTSQDCPFKEAWAEKECYNVLASNDSLAGTVCVEVFNGPLVIEVTRKVEGDWALISSEFWVGDDASKIPKRKNGAPNIERFPYFGGNSSGALSWSGVAFLEDSYNCDGASEYTVQMAVHSSYMKKFDNGTLIPGTKESSFTYQPNSGYHTNQLAWIPLRLVCKCTTHALGGTHLHASPFAPKHPATTGPALLPSSMHQEHCIGGTDGTGRECHDMMIGKGTMAGSLCVEAVEDSDNFEFTFTSANGYTLLSSSFWLGDSVSEVPTVTTGEANNMAFPYFWRNSTGENVWKSQISLNVSFDCDVIKEYKLAVVASSTFAQVAADGTLIDDTEVVAFIDKNSGDKRGFGWFDLALRCDCKSTLESIQDALFGIGNDAPGSCVASSVFVDEDYEANGSEDAWDNGVITKGDDLTYFLGRLGGDYAPRVSRMLEIPLAPDGTKASSLSIEFVLYTIDAWKQGDSVAVIVGGNEIDLGNLASGNNSSGDVSDAQAGISWNRNVISQGSNLGFGEADDEKHLVQLTVPSDQFSDLGELFFGVSVILNDDPENSAGVDDLTIEANYDCPEQHGRLLRDGRIVQIPAINQSASEDLIDDEEATNSDDDDDDGEEREQPKEDSRYCTANDFPCGQNEDDVYVCHYSRSRGFQTLCIPETESHVLSFYPQDYCGPCVGSVGSLARLSWNWS